MVMAEAMACGTPVIAYRAGSVAEVIDDGVTGFVCDDLADAVAAVERVGELSRTTCRQVFEQRFTAARMAAAYSGLYHRILQPGDRGDRDDCHDGRHGDSRGLLHPRDQLASG
jgi:glycosyltransferase involved in cell wall biosynthesis